MPQLILIHYCYDSGGWAVGTEAEGFGVDDLLVRRHDPLVSMTPRYQTATVPLLWLQGPDQENAVLPSNQ